MKKCCIVIVGATATGKTDWAIALAKYYKTEILSADSRQCYKELQIGTSKPRADYLKSIAHYFINSHSIHTPVNTKIYETYALESLEEIFKKTDIAIVVGGTPLYLDALCHGIDEIPDINIKIRQQLRNEFEEKGLDWLQKTVQHEDPLFYKTREKENPHRLLRALEVMRSHQQSILCFQKKDRPKRNFQIIKIGIHCDKNILHERITTRIHAMIHEGLQDEVASLQPYWHLQALQTIGYREWIPYFNQTATIDNVIERILINTRQYAKRQMTWFKKDTTIQWIHTNDHTNKFLRLISDRRLL